MNEIDALDLSRAACYPCAFSVKAAVLLLYFDFTPRGEWKEKFLDRLIRHLADQPMQHDAPLEWLFKFNTLLNMSRKPSGAQAQELRDLQTKGKVPNALPSELGPKILQSMKQSGNRILYSYAVSDEVLDNKYVIPPHAD